MAPEDVSTGSLRTKGRTRENEVLQKKKKIACGAFNKSSESFMTKLPFCLSSFFPQSINLYLHPLLLK